MKELKVEEYLDAEAKRRGGFTVKLSPVGYVGIADRMVVLPNGVLLFVELKRPKGGRIAPLQKWWRDRFMSRGHRSVFAHTFARVDEVLDEAQAGT